jgi:hypothetical protein
MTPLDGDVAVTVKLLPIVLVGMLTKLSVVDSAETLKLVVAVAAP